MALDSNYKSRQDWIDCGLLTLAQQGANALSAARLAKALGVTRGSFYHHFSSMPAFTAELLQSWAERNTLTAFREAQANSQSAQDEIDQLIQFAWAADSSLEVAIRAWATTSSQVAEFVAQLDAVRLAELTRLYQALAGDVHQGASLAKIAFYGLLGAYHAQPRLTTDQLRKLILEIQAVMLQRLETQS